MGADGGGGGGGAGAGVGGGIGGGVAGGGVGEGMGASSGTSQEPSRPRNVGMAAFASGVRCMPWMDASTETMTTPSAPPSPAALVFG